MMWRIDFKDVFFVDQDYDEWIVRSNKFVFLLLMMDFEDGGVMVYWLLLYFFKDCLIVICLENNVLWFEDYINKDLMLIMRNVVRQMWKNYCLLEVFQKLVIL